MNTMTARRHNFFSTSGLTYAGEAATPILTAALLSGDTLANNWVRTLEGIRHKGNFDIIGGTNLLQAAGCDFNDGNDITLTEKAITVKDLKVNETICRNTLLNTWLGTASGRNSNVGSPEFFNFIAAYVAAKVAEQVETIIWQGNTGLSFTGFLGADGSAGTSTDLAAGTLAGCTSTTALSTITAGNAIEQIGLAYSHAADTKPAILSRSTTGVYISPKTAALYMQNLSTIGSSAGYNNQVTNQGFPNLQYLGVPVRVCPGFPDNAVLISDSDNLVVGTNLKTDLANVRIIPAYEYDGSDNIKVVMNFQIGTEAGVETDSVYATVS